MDTRHDRKPTPALSLPQARRRALCAAALPLALTSLPGCAAFQGKRAPHPQVGFLDIGPDLHLRHRVARPAKPKGIVLFLHGFPETLYAWEAVTSILASDYEVHAFDWPGYGLSSRPPADRFAYAPRDYARVLKAYIHTAGIDTSRLVIYATDIGALPALLLALDEPGIARALVVGDFAPFDRPQHMNPRLQSLKSKPSAEATRATLNATWEEILENAFRRGLPDVERFQISRRFRDDMSRGWHSGSMTSADAFYHYYSHFTRDQNHLESRLHALRTPTTVIWGEKDIYINPEMGAEFARRTGAKLNLLPGLGHYPHLQRPQQTVDEVVASFAFSEAAGRQPEAPR